MPPSDGSDLTDDEPDFIEALIVDLGPEAVGQRLDKALALAAPDLSRARIQALMAEGRVTYADEVMTDGSSRAREGLYLIAVPEPLPAEPQPEDIPLTVLFEDEHLIVIDKPAGMTVHPAPGHQTGTLVNALLFHCGDSLSGIGGVLRPGIVHRLDKDTSGVMVAAKSDAAHQGLSALFATHDLERQYIALTRGQPRPASGRVENRIGRSNSDRKKMAVLKTSGRLAITDYRTATTFGPQDRPLASRVVCRLHTGRTHQIRVHMASIGAPVLGDPIYGSGPPAPSVRQAIQTTGLDRQALHAAVLGFVHPITGATLRFETPLPADMSDLEQQLAEL
ncbi:RluA family pseudouridine synthase [Brevundimonas aveniformis]|uniref:RluA family pseudouridine synthase n=1 Tax=Brevundimonas aveniformis TaxID=370977 RepID=UPI003CD0C4BA